MTLSKDELASGLEDRRWLIWVLFERSLIYHEISGVTKGFTTEAGAPALRLSLLVIGVTGEEDIQSSDDELVEIGELENTISAGGLLADLEYIQSRN